MLIDLENVQPDSLSALDNDHFKVIVFVGATQAKLPFKLAAAMQCMGEKAEYVRISGSGSNALDFHIAFYIGQLAAQHSSASFHIISKDTGFDPLLQHLKAKKILADRSPSIDSLALVKLGDKKPPERLAKPLVKVGNKKNPEQLAELFIKTLHRPKATKPRREKSLSNAVACFFQKQLAEQEVLAVVAAMRSMGLVRIADGNVSYGPWR